MASKTRRLRVLEDRMAVARADAGGAGRGTAPETGGMYRGAIKDVSAWTVGDFRRFDQ